MSQIDKQDVQAKKAGDAPWYADALVTLLFLGGAAVIYSEFADLDSGATNSVREWVPLLWLYRHFGPIGASVPLIACGIFTTITALRKLLARK